MTRARDANVMRVTHILNTYARRHWLPCGILHVLLFTGVVASFTQIRIHSILFIPHVLSFGLG